MHSLALLPLRQPASLFPYPDMGNSAPSLALLCHRKPPSLLPLPRWPVPGRGHALAGPAPSSPSATAVPSPCVRQFLPVVIHSLGLLPLPSPRDGSFLSEVTPWLGLFPARKPALASLFTDAEMANSAPWPGMLPHRKPECLFPLPEMARSFQRSPSDWDCSLFASRHPGTLSQRLPTPALGRALAAAAPSSQTGIAVPCSRACQFCAWLRSGCHQHGANWKTRFSNLRRARALARTASSFQAL